MAPNTSAFSSRQMAEEIVSMSMVMEDLARQAFIDAMNQAADDPALIQIINEISSGELVELTPELLERIDALSINTTDLQRIMTDAFSRAGQITQLSTELAIAFDLFNPRAVDYLKSFGVEIQTISANVKANIKALLVKAIEGDMGRAELRRLIKSQIGLLPQHTDAVDRYLANLIRDGMSLRQAKKLAGAYADRLLGYRATMIARTETGRAIGYGQWALWQQALEQNMIPNNAQRVWITAQDEMVCDVCRPMDGERAEIDGPFYVDGNPIMVPEEVHPQCRCSTGLVFPTPISKADPLGYETWLIKGDYAGHPFRGNQHTGGIYHGSRSEYEGKKFRESQEVYNRSIMPELIEDVSPVVNGKATYSDRTGYITVTVGNKSWSGNYKPTTHTLRYGYENRFHDLVDGEFSFDDWIGDYGCWMHRVASASLMGIGLREDMVGRFFDRVAFSGLGYSAVSQMDKNARIAQNLLKAGTPFIPDVEALTGKAGVSEMEARWVYNKEGQVERELSDDELKAEVDMAKREVASYIASSFNALEAINNMAYELSLGRQLQGANPEKPFIPKPRELPTPTKVIENDIYRDGKKTVYTDEYTPQVEVLKQKVYRGLSNIPENSSILTAPIGSTYKIPLTSFSTRETNAKSYLRDMTGGGYGGRGMSHYGSKNVLVVHEAGLIAIRNSGKGKDPNIKTQVITAGEFEIVSRTPASDGDYEIVTVRQVATHGGKASGPKSKFVPIDRDGDGIVNEGTDQERRITKLDDVVENWVWYAMHDHYPESVDIAKGDFAGHPFRGNQHTGGIYHGESGLKRNQKKKSGSSVRMGKPISATVNWGSGKKLPTMPKGMTWADIFAPDPKLASEVADEFMDDDSPVISQAKVTKSSDGDGNRIYTIEGPNGKTVVTHPYFEDPPEWQFAKWVGNFNCWMSRVASSSWLGLSLRESMVGSFAKRIGLEMGEPNGMVDKSYRVAGEILSKGDLLQDEDGRRYYMGEDDEKRYVTDGDYEVAKTLAGSYVMHSHAAVQHIFDIVGEDQKWKRLGPEGDPFGEGDPFTDEDSWKKIGKFYRGIDGVLTTSALLSAPVGYRYKIPLTSFTNDITTATRYATHDLSGKSMNVGDQSVLVEVDNGLYGIQEYDSPYNYQVVSAGEFAIKSRNYDPSLDVWTVKVEQIGVINPKDNSVLPIDADGDGVIFEGTDKERTITKSFDVVDNWAWYGLQDYYKEVVKRPNITKGDFAGHPFRGNQHTGGIYHGAKGLKINQKGYKKEQKKGLGKYTSTGRLIEAGGDSWGEKGDFYELVGGKSSIIIMDPKTSKPNSLWGQIIYDMEIGKDVNPELVQQLAEAVFEMNIQTEDGKVYYVRVDSDNTWQSSEEVQVNVDVLDADKKIVGSADRILNFGDRSVYNSSFDIYSEHQGKGIATAVLRHWEDQFAEIGMESMRTLAMSGGSMSGAYSWLKTGYEPDFNEAADIVQSYVRRYDYDELRFNMKKLAERYGNPTSTMKSMSANSTAYEVAGIYMQSFKSSADAMLALALGEAEFGFPISGEHSYPSDNGFKDYLAQESVSWRGTKQVNEIIMDPPDGSYDAESIKRERERKLPEKGERRQPYQQPFDRETAEAFVDTFLSKKDKKAMSGSQKVIEQWTLSDPAGLENDDPEFVKQLLNAMKKDRKITKSVLQRPAILVKGDFVGHPFRGNQWTGGIYHGAKGTLKGRRRKAKQEIVENKSISPEPLKPNNFQSFNPDEGYAEPVPREQWEEATSVSDGEVLLDIDSFHDTASEEYREAMKDFEKTVGGTVLYLQSPNGSIMDDIDWDSDVDPALQALQKFEERSGIVVHDSFTDNWDTYMDGDKQVSYLPYEISVLVATLDTLLYGKEVLGVAPSIIQTNSTLANHTVRMPDSTYASVSANIPHSEAGDRRHDSNARNTEYGARRAGGFATQVTKTMGLELGVDIALNDVGEICYPNIGAVMQINSMNLETRTGDVDVSAEIVKTKTDHIKSNILGITASPAFLKAGYDQETAKGLPLGSRLAEDALGKLAVEDIPIGNGGGEVAGRSSIQHWGVASALHPLQQNIIHELGHVYKYNLQSGLGGGLRSLINLERRAGLVLEKNFSVKSPNTPVAVKSAWNGKGSSKIQKIKSKWLGPSSEVWEDVDSVLTKLKEWGKANTGPYGTDNFEQLGEIVTVVAYDTDPDTGSINVQGELTGKLMPTFFDVYKGPKIRKSWDKTKKWVQGFSPFGNEGTRDNSPSETIANNLGIAISAYGTYNDHEMFAESFLGTVANGYHRQGKKPFPALKALNPDRSVRLKKRKWNANTDKDLDNFWDWSGKSVPPKSVKDATSEPTVGALLDDIMTILDDTPKTPAKPKGVKGGGSTWMSGRMLWEDLTGGNTYSTWEEYARTSINDVVEKYETVKAYPIYDEFYKEFGAGMAETGKEGAIDRDGDGKIFDGTPYERSA